jgi:uncharacterized protein
VTNITNFGAFVDIGVHQDGLVHLSQITNRFIKDPNEVLKVAQKVLVTVTEVDAARKRISLTMKDNEKREPVAQKPPLNKPSFNKAAPKPVQNKPYASKPAAQEAEGDLQLKLAALRNIFK